MRCKEAVFYLEQIKNVCEKSHMDTEAEALSMAIDVLKEREEHRRSWEEIIAEERT